MRVVAFFVCVGIATLAAIGLAVYYTTQTSEVQVSTAGVIAMVVGIVVTFLVGAGLMFLVFLSARRDQDDDQ